jgi:cell division septation protein DedD
METIIGLLFILLPVILKIIGKRLEQSGQPEKAKKLQDFLDTISSEEDDVDDEMEVEYDDDGQIISVHPKMIWEPEPVSTPAPEKTFVFESKPAPAVKKQKKPVLMEETPKKKSEKIDPKKLVIYSEIMKPKF